MVDLQIVLPIHNEAESIEATLKEWRDELAPRVDFEFIASEDGSIDNTKEVLGRIQHELPIKLMVADERKGYSRAVIDAFKASESDHVLAVDSDGQCDPKDFWAFWDRRNDFDIVLGWRVNRADRAVRRIMSGAFKLWYRLLMGVPVHDPSCPFLLIRKEVLDSLVSELGVLKQGFWWEFIARAHRRGFRILELPVNHRQRAAGVTQVYKWNKVPGIAFSHGLGLVKIWRETR